MTDSILRRLNVGEAVSDIPVQARNPWNGSGIAIGGGERYRVVATHESWSDAAIECMADGQPGKGVQRYAHCLVRCRKAPWFALIAGVKVPESRLLPVGMAAEIVFEFFGEAELAFFANDLPGMYWNNTGVIHVTVERIA